MPLYAVRVNENVIRTYKVYAGDLNEALTICDSRLGPFLIDEDFDKAEVLDAELLKSIPIYEFLLEKEFVYSIKSGKQLARMLKVNGRKIGYGFEIDPNQEITITLGDVILYYQEGTDPAWRGK